MKKTLIKNGLIIDPSQNIEQKGNLLIVGDKIEAIIHEEFDADEVIDAKGKIIAPGFIDLHVHLREPGFEYKETIETGTLSAAAGGFTSVCCMANTNPVNDAASVTDYIKKQSREYGLVNVFPIGALTKGLKGKELSQIGELKKSGCVGLSDDGMCVENPQLMRLAMEYAKSFDLPVLTHSVDPKLCEGRVMNEGFLSTKLGLPGIPNEAEDITIARDIYLAKLTGARLHICHIATAGGVDLVKRAKEAGLPVTAEVAPHHFTLTDEAVNDYDTDAKMMPPLRSEEDRQAVINGLAHGIIDAIATDHAPHAPVDKHVEFEHACCGVVGLETALSLSLELVKQNRLTLMQLIKSLTINPAQIVNLDKGTLKSNTSADVVVFDPDHKYIVDSNLFASKSKNSPFNGRETVGKINYTIVNGEIVYKN